MPRNWPSRLPRANAEQRCPAAPPGAGLRTEAPGIFRRLCCATLLCCLLCLGRAAVAQEYPMVSVSVALPAPLGSQDDRLFSLLSSFLGRYADQPFVTEHMPGRSGSYAVTSLLNKDANGYFLAVIAVPGYLLLPQSRMNMFTYWDLTPISMFAYVPTALWVAVDSPFASLADLISHMRDNAEQGIVAGAGSYTEQQMASMIFERAAGVKALYMPLLGSSECRQAVLDKRAAACWGLALGADSMPGLRALAVAGLERSPMLPDVPTFREADLDIVNGKYYGLALSAKTPGHIAAEVSAFYAKALSQEDFTGAAGRLGFYPMSISLDGMAVFLEEQAAYLDAFLDAYPGMFPRGAGDSIRKALEPKETDAGDAEGNP